MRALALIIGSAAAFACSCTAAQARVAHRGGEIALAAGLIGILADVIVAEAVPGPDNTVLGIGLVFVPIAVGGALVYVATDSYVNEDRERATTQRDRAFDTAFDLARQAKHAARRGDCAEVQAIQPRVRDLDEHVYRRFLHDDVIRTCLGPAPESPAP
jgi:hypothetical protein